MYRDEADKTRSTIEQMEKDAAADEYEIRQQVRACERAAAVVDVRADFGDSSQRRVLAESERIIPDSEQRLAKAIDDLEDLLVRPTSVRCSLANPDLTPVSECRPCTGQYRGLARRVRGVQEGFRRHQTRAAGMSCRWRIE